MVDKEVIMNHYIDIGTAQKLIKREPTDLYTYYKQLHDPEVTLVKGVTDGLYGFNSDLQSNSMAIHLYEYTTAFDIDQNKIVYVKVDEN